ncbi:MAG: hypothetical protein AB7U73_23850 [Pirellulales bacterium]|uniref:hypothetical protein n=1 Tax=Bradyrhizobium sp. TaxID=376 RepID=UPI003D1024C8
MPEARDFGSSILAQQRPANTSAADLYSPAANRRAIVSKIIVCNTTGSAANASVFADADGSTKDATTALLYAKSVAANDKVELLFEDGLELAAAGTLGCQSGTNDALTFTVLGRELDA